MNTRGLRRIERKITSNYNLDEQLRLANECIKAMREKRPFNYPIPFAQRITLVDIVKYVKGLP